MTKEEKIKQKAQDYVMNNAALVAESDVCPDCGSCWLWAYEMHCERRAIMEAYIAGANGE